MEDNLFRETKTKWILRSIERFLMTNSDIAVIKKTKSKMKKAVLILSKEWKNDIQKMEFVFLSIKR